jgi:predicted phage terminase large subunit-like protein
MLVMETRRGLDDIQGWAQAEYPGRVRSMAWTCRAEEGDPWRREAGAYLWPERTATGWGGYDAAWHASRPDLQGGRIWETQYQQRPVVEGGEVIRSEWTSHRYDGDPLAVRSSCSRVMLFCDPSSTTRDRADPTAIQVWGVRGRARLLLHAEVIRPDDLTRRLTDLQAMWRAEGIALEATSIGPEIARALQRAGLRGVLTLPVSGRGDKVARMTPHLPAWAAGDIQLPASAPWVARYVGEITTVPSAPHDDEWDCTSLALAYYADHDTARAQPVRGIW